MSTCGRSAGVLVYGVFKGEDDAETTVSISEGISEIVAKGLVPGWAFDHRIEIDRDRPNFSLVVWFSTPVNFEA